MHVSSVQTPITIRNQIIKPNDLIHADKHGFAIIPFDKAEEILSFCQILEQSEKEIINPCQEAIINGKRPTLEEILEWNGNVKK